MSDVSIMVPRTGPVGIAFTNSDNGRVQVGCPFGKSVRGSEWSPCSADADIIQVGLEPPPTWTRTDAIPGAQHVAVGSLPPHSLGESRREGPSAGFLGMGVSWKSWI
jgi:hypothetical protein